MKESIYNDGHVEEKGAAAIATIAHLRERHFHYGDDDSKVHSRNFE